MKKEEWDNEAKKLAHEIVNVETMIHRLWNSPSLYVMRKKLEVLETQRNLEIIVEKFVRASKSISSQLNKRQKSIVHWCGVLASASLELYRKKARYGGAEMWLKLIKARLQGKEADPSLLVDDRDLIELALQHNQLLENERFLNHRLVELHRTKDQLRQKYAEDETVAMNIEAAGGFQGSLGKDFDEARVHPSYEGLHSLFTNLSRTTEEGARIEADLERIGRYLLERTDRLVEECRSVIIAYTGKRFPIAHLESLHSKLQQIDNLQERIDELADQVLSYRVPDAHPKFAKRAH